MHLKLPNVKILQFDGHSNWSDPSHSHNECYQISIPFHGNTIATLNQKEKVLSKGNAIVANPNSTHSHQFKTESSSLVILGFNRDVLNKWLIDEENLKEEVIFNEEQEIFNNDLKLKMKQWFSLYILNEGNQSTFIDDLEVSIFQYFSSILRGSHNIKEPLQLVSDIHLNRILDYIHSHYSDNMTVETLAGIAQQSKYHFIRTFKKTTGFTPHQYIMIFRIKKAKELLLFSSKSVTEISYELGFSSSSQFYRNFTNLVGCSPQKFREDNVS
ncbi:helix-turn-helix domain-containing protein [Bacillaceae bacterium CLA-AA-H227]|uniref:Helix-turn-helix domain-containing protein n=1 Tax=Robertmurraya yapensis (ex Hitch et al 2024) TaxID=3133160 RepID=A0ACC6SGM4_9BACI